MLLCCLTGTSVSYVAIDGGRVSGAVRADDSGVSALLDTLSACGAPTRAATSIQLEKFNRSYEFHCCWQLHFGRCTAHVVEHRSRRVRRGPRGQVGSNTRRADCRHSLPQLSHILHANFILQTFTYLPPNLHSQNTFPLT